MKQRIEHENKYTVTSLPNKDYWDRYVLVYQFTMLFSQMFDFLFGH